MRAFGSQLERVAEILVEAGRRHDEARHPTAGAA